MLRGLEVTIFWCAVLSALSIAGLFSFVVWRLFSPIRLYEENETTPSYIRVCSKCGHWDTLNDRASYTCAVCAPENTVVRIHPIRDNEPRYFRGTPGKVVVVSSKEEGG